MHSISRVFDTQRIEEFGGGHIEKVCTIKCYISASLIVGYSEWYAVEATVSSSTECHDTSRGTLSTSLKNDMASMKLPPLSLKAPPKFTLFHYSRKYPSISPSPSVGHSDLPRSKPQSPILPHSLSRTHSRPPISAC